MAGRKVKVESLVNMTHELGESIARVTKYH